MPACFCDHANCCKCRIRTGPPTPHNQAYWQKWGVRLDEVTLPIKLLKPPRPAREPRPIGPAKKAKAIPLACVHRSIEPLSKTDYIGSPCECQDKWLFACTAHGTCVKRHDRPEANMVCKECDERQPISTVVASDAIVSAGG